MTIEIDQNKKIEYTSKSLKPLNLFSLSLSFHSSLISQLRDSRQSAKFFRCFISLFRAASYFFPRCKFCPLKKIPGKSLWIYHNWFAMIK